MKQKTAMQQLKEKLQDVVNEIWEDFQDGTPNGFNQGYLDAMQNVVKDIDAQMLELEKKQIIDAYDEGEREMCYIVKQELGSKISIPDDKSDAEQYYTQTFN